MTDKPKDPDVLGRALRKQEQGRGTSATEKRALYDFAAGKIGRDHFSAIATSPVRQPEPLAPSDNKIRSIQEIDGLEAALRKGGPTDDASDLYARVATLEALLAGLSQQTITYCSGGTSSSRIILMS